jgi:transcriptional regulator with XRE-family HTH domain
MARTKTPANVVGPQVRKLRNKLDLTQEELAARCQLHGLDISRGTLSQIEARLRRVTDSELFRLSVVLKVSTDDLFPSELRKERDKLRTRQ